MQNRSTSFPCDQCIMRFENAQQLREHIERVHWRLPLFPFRETYEHFEQNQNSIVENNSATNQCIDLSHKRSSEDNSNTIVPEKRSRDEASSSQDSNNIGMYQLGTYNRSNTPCICSYCNVQLPNFKSFLLHMESHVSTNSSVPDIATTQQNKACPVCGDQYYDPVELINHVFGHAATSVPGKCCLQCRKIENDAESVQRHLLQEHTQLLYKCSICSELFDAQDSLQVSKDSHSKFIVLYYVFVVSSGTL